MDFKGYFRVARDHPTTNDWTTFDVLVNITDLRLQGEHKGLGKVTVNLNPNILSSGQIFHANIVAGPAKCRIATATIFDLPQAGIRVYNKEPILLMNEKVKSIPPIDDPNGHALLFMLPLFDYNKSSEKPLAYLTSLRYGADNYLSEAEVKHFHSSIPRLD